MIPYRVPNRKLPFATADSPLHFELSDGTNDTGSPPSMPLTRPVPALSLPFPLSIPPQPQFSEKILRPKSHWRLHSLFNTGCHDAIRHQPRAGIQLGAKHAVVQLSTSSLLCPGFRTLNMCQMPPTLFHQHSVTPARDGAPWKRGPRSHWRLALAALFAFTGLFQERSYQID